MITDQEIMEMAVKCEKLQIENRELKARVEELEYQLDGWTKCQDCDGEGGGFVGRQLTPSPDPNSYVDCNACNGEGWVK